ncbi:hypothetical protein K701_13115 [Streptomyces fradiae ATCC 10745 = DSM 40063]|uniref:Uncharacterized protein n=1 Tax=Streptomyces fradiae ATCC 10745 = DSM 40063 TaxID=1319510 RepID=A0ABQ6XUV0_STRFR|nr:hypothetical protein K701_13115 [Streptomyces fradiae ATCC 10745 = DSM 40063]
MLTVGWGHPGDGYGFGARVRRLDAQDVTVVLQLQDQEELPAGYASVDGRVGGEFGDDLEGVGGLFPVHAVVAQPGGGQLPPEPRTRPRGGQLHAQLACGRGQNGVGVVHVTDRGCGVIVSASDLVRAYSHCQVPDGACPACRRRCAGRACTVAVVRRR